MGFGISNFVRIYCYNTFKLLSAPFTIKRENRIRNVGGIFEDQVRANNQFNESTTAVWTINNSQLKVYPNPAGSKLIISGISNGANSGKVTIYTLDGKKCYNHMDICIQFFIYP